MASEGSGPEATVATVGVRRELKSRMEEMRAVRLDLVSSKDCGRGGAEREGKEDGWRVQAFRQVQCTQGGQREP